MAMRPVLRGYLSRGRLFVFCPECDCWHVHGWPDGEKGPSHRIAHCTRGAYQVSGYYVAPLRQSDLSAIRESLLLPVPSGGRGAGE